MQAQTRLKRIVLIISLLLLVCGRFAGSMYAREPFSAHMKKAELIFIGTVVDKEIIREGTTALHTDLTFHVDKLIEGTPNIDDDTVKFRVPGQVHPSNSRGQIYRELEVGDTLMMLMNANKHFAIRYGWFYPISASHGCWFVKSKEVDTETEYTVYLWASSKKELNRHFLGMPLPLMVRFIDAARKHPESMDPVAEVIGNALIKSYQGIETTEAARIRHGILTYIELALEGLEAIDTRTVRIDVQRLAGAAPDTADVLLRKMILCRLKHENRWQEEHGDVQGIVGKLFMREYEVENGQIDKWQRKPGITLHFDADYEERVNQVVVSYVEFVSAKDALQRIGYDPIAAIAHPTSPKAWYFITAEYLHQVHWENNGQSSGITIFLDPLTIVD